MKRTFECLSFNEIQKHVRILFPHEVTHYLWSKYHTRVQYGYNTLMFSTVSYPKPFILTCSVLNAELVPCRYAEIPTVGLWYSQLCVPKKSKLNATINSEILKCHKHSMLGSQKWTFNETYSNCMWRFDFSFKKMLHWALSGKCIQLTTVPWFNVNKCCILLSFSLKYEKK